MAAHMGFIYFLGPALGSVSCCPGVSVPPPFSCSVGPTLQDGTAPGTCSVWLCFAAGRGGGSTPAWGKFSWARLHPHGWPPAPATAHEHGSRRSVILHFASCHTAELLTSCDSDRSLCPSSPTCAVCAVVIPPSLGRGRQASLVPSDGAVLGC